MALRLGTIPTEQIDVRWSEIEPFVASFLAETEGESTSHSVWQALTTGNMQCWTLEDDDGLKGIVVTEITIFPAMKILQIIGCAGTGILDIVENVVVIENWARYIGCKKMMLQGRKGWERVLKPFGWRGSYTVVMKDIESEQR